MTAHLTPVPAPTTSHREMADGFQPAAMRVLDGEHHQVHLELRYQAQNLIVDLIRHTRGTRFAALLIAELAGTAPVLGRELRQAEIASHIAESMSRAGLTVHEMDPEQGREFCDQIDSACIECDVCAYSGIGGDCPNLVEPCERYCPEHDGRVH